MFPFDPPENIRKPKVFWCFQGDQNGTLGSKGLTWSSTSTYVVVETLLLWLFLDFKPSYMPFMIQKRLWSLSTKVHWNFYDMINICLIMENNVNIFTIYESLL